MKVLLTTTSFQDTPGVHQELLYSQGFDIETLRGPILEEELLPIIHKYDAIICGDDEYTASVIKKGVSGKLKYLCKYGVGLDRIDLEAAKTFNVAVTNCPELTKFQFLNTFWPYCLLIKEIYICNIILYKREV